MVKRIILILTGLISLGLSIGAFSKYKGTIVCYESYGGDAYTGIQHAAADTAVNVIYLTESVNYGFGSILLVCSLACFAFAFSPCKNYKKDNPESTTPTQTEQ